jgi:hypothetical protein
MDGAMQGHAAHRQAGGSAHGVDERRVGGDEDEGVAGEQGAEAIEEDLGARLGIGGEGEGEPIEAGVVAVEIAAAGVGVGGRGADHQHRVAVLGDDGLREERGEVGDRRVEIVLGGDQGEGGGHLRAASHPVGAV